MSCEINPFIIPFPVTIVTDEAEFAECVKGLGAEPPSIEGDAITVAVRDKGVVVWVDKGLELGALVGAAAHEATHAALDLLAMIGEEDPGCEIMAYMVQSIAVGIFVACHRTTDSADSWEKLEEDAKKTTCELAGMDMLESCRDCVWRPTKTDVDCNTTARLEILKRAKKLAGIEEEARNDD